MHNYEIVALLAGVVPLIGLAAAWAVDGRSSGRSRRRDFATIHHNFWRKMKRKRSQRRFRQTVRCDPDTFDHIVDLVTPIYEEMFGRPHHNAKYDIEARLAVTLHYLGRGKAMEDSATQFGMSKSSAVR